MVRFTKCRTLSKRSSPMPKCRRKRFVTAATLHGPSVAAPATSSAWICRTAASCSGPYFFALGASPCRRRPKSTSGRAYSCALARHCLTLRVLTPNAAAVARMPVSYDRIAACNRASKVNRRLRPPDGGDGDGGIIPGDGDSSPGDINPGDALLSLIVLLALPGLTLATLAIPFPFPVTFTYRSPSATRSLRLQPFALLPFPLTLPLPLLALHVSGTRNAPWEYAYPLTPCPCPCPSGW